MKRGVKPMYHSVDDMQAAIDDYFASIDPSQVTITGLALHLGFTSRQALINYEEKPEFVDTVKFAKLRVENSYELGLRARGNSGDIFALKNFGWSDQQDINIGGQKDNPVETNLTVTFVKPA